MENYSLEWYYIFVFFICSVITVICLVVLIYNVFLAQKLLGSNLRTILLITLTFVLLLPCGNGVNAYASLFIPQGFKTPWIRYACGSGGHIFRLASTAILIERLIATYYARIYDRHKILRHTDIIVSIGCVLVSLGIPGVTVFLQISDTFIIIFITLSLFANVFLTMFLVKKNQALRRLTQMNPLLNLRYQLAMNLRLLSILQPFIIFIAIINFIGVITLYIVAFWTQSFLYGYNALYYVYYFGIYCSTGYILIKKYFRHGTSNKVKGIRVVTITNNEAPVKVLTTMGGYLPTSQSLDSYFKELNSAWK